MWTLSYRMDFELVDDFPSFAVEEQFTRIVVNTEKQLTQEQVTALKTVIARFGSGQELDIQIGLVSAPSINKTFLNGVVTPSRMLGSHVAETIRKAVRRDENEWLCWRQKLLDVPDEVLLPTTEGMSIEPHLLSCVVDAAVFPPRDIRTYLTIYDRVFLCPPLDEMTEQSLSSLGLTLEELVTLAYDGRVVFLCRHGLERYSPALLEAVMNVAPDSLLLSRYLARLLTEDLWRRVPWLHALVPLQERRAFLAELNRVRSSMAVGAKHHILFSAIATTLAEYWDTNMENMYLRGAMGPLTANVGSILAEVIRYLTGSDRLIELAQIGGMVQLSGALHAHYAPVKNASYSEERGAMMVANVDELMDEFNQFITAVNGSTPAVHKMRISGSLINGDDRIPPSEAIHGFMVPFLEEARKQNPGSLLGLSRILADTKRPRGSSILVCSFCDDG